MLDYIALALVFVVFFTLFYGIIVIHDIPYEIAKHRNHPHQDAIHVAGWVSLLTLHVIWPFLWIWATLYREDRGWGFVGGRDGANSPQQPVLEDIHQRLDALQAQLDALQSQQKGN
ncbi:MAG: DUF3302 domain-containing protein [Candidatus Competibacteraceae bacterium]|nr:DUF3302 domain-containing protein [Candidatus Competibacteraceae bacterium]